VHSRGGRSVSHATTWDFYPPKGNKWRKKSAPRASVLRLKREIGTFCPAHSQAFCLKWRRGETPTYEETKMILGHPTKKS